MAGQLGRQFAGGQSSQYSCSSMVAVKHRSGHRLAFDVLIAETQASEQDSVSRLHCQIPDRTQCKVAADLRGHVVLAAFLATLASFLRISCRLSMLQKFQVSCCLELMPCPLSGFMLILLCARTTPYTRLNVMRSEAASTSGRQGATPSGSVAASSSTTPASGSAAASSAGAGGLPGSRLGGTSRLFENVKPMAAEEVLAATAEAPSEPGAAMRMVTTAGNAALLGLLGAGAFFGYYTVRYDADTLQTVVQETHKEENQFAGSSVGMNCVGCPTGHRVCMNTTCMKLHSICAGLAPCDGVVP